MKKRVLIAFGALFVAFLLIQLIPYRVSNLPVGQEPRWDSPYTSARGRRVLRLPQQRDAQLLVRERRPDLVVGQRSRRRRTFGAELLGVGPRAAP